MSTLSDLCTSVSEQCNPAHSDASVYVGLEHIKGGAFRLTSTGIPSDVQSTKNMFRRGDVLYGKLRPYLDKAVIAEDAGICSTDILVLRPKETVSGVYLLSLLHTDRFLAHAVSTTNGVNHPRTSWSGLASFECAAPSPDEQKKMAAVLWKLQRGVELQDQAIVAVRDVKAAAMRRVFAAGLRGEATQDTDLGRIPRTWMSTLLDQCCDVLNSSISYTDFANLAEATGPQTVEAMGIKVSDMNLLGNETRMTRANLTKRVSQKFAEKKMVPANTTVFPKRGAAIATNKKRLTTTWTVLDPNLIGVNPHAGLDPHYLFYWFQTFDLRAITEPGPTPQLNKKNLTPLRLPIPPTLDEQREIADFLAKLDSQIEFHELKRGALSNLYKVALQRIMEGDLRVSGLDIDVSDVLIH